MPSKEDIFDNGIYIETKESSGKEAVSNYVFSDLDYSKEYVFYICSVSART